MEATVWERYRRYLAAPPEIVVEWSDPPTGARGWLVLNSLRGGAAGGGTRMRRGVTREEVVYLAKAMELKFAFSGPAIGGGKSGIEFDPRDPRRRDVLRRWFEAMRPLLSSCYGTGGDVGVDEQRDVAPLCRELGLPHPQVGILVGHFRASADRAECALEALRVGLGLPLAGTVYGVGTLPLTVSDMITGWAVARATRRLLAGGGRLDDLRVEVEGFGNVGGSAALYLTRAGARLVGVSDADSDLRDASGLDATAVEDLLVRRRGGAIPHHSARRPHREGEEPPSVGADLFVPAAISGSVDRPRLERLSRAGVRTLVCGANQPFRESSLGDTRTQEAADAAFTVLPDVVASMGMARAFDHLMNGGDRDSPAAIFETVAESVDEAVDAVTAHSRGARPGLLAGALDLALNRTAHE